MTPDNSTLARLERRLMEAGSDFVSGRGLSAFLGVQMEALGALVAQLRRHRPALTIEGKRGYGYRIIRSGNAGAVIAAAPARGSGVVPANIRMAQEMAMLDLIPAETAEIVKSLALQSKELPVETLARLVAYGSEVHHDLVASGENPLGLRRSA